MRSTATMLFGHIETAAQRVDHLLQLRHLQDETAGFTALIPYAFVPETTALAHIKPASKEECLKNIAVARLLLDNFDHITAYWISFGLPLATEMLRYGADDLHGTIYEEKIFHMAGATTPQEQTVITLEQSIIAVGREPRQRDTFYKHLPSPSTEAVKRGVVPVLTASSTSSTLLCCAPSAPSSSSSSAKAKAGVGPSYLASSAEVTTRGVVPVLS